MSRLQKLSELISTASGWLLHPQKKTKEQQKVHTPFHMCQECNITKLEPCSVLNRAKTKTVTYGKRELEE